MKKNLFVQQIFLKILVQKKTIIRKGLGDF